MINKINKINKIKSEPAIDRMAGLSFFDLIL
jgi:hypothetical protein